MDNNETNTTYRGSIQTRTRVEKQIRERWGEAAADRYEPYKNCLTLRMWNKLGFRVKKGETAIRSIVMVEDKGERGEVIRLFPRNVYLFFETQVEPVNQEGKQA